MARRCAANGALVGGGLAGNGLVAFCARGDGSACAVPVDRCARCVDDLREGVDRMSSLVDDLQAAVDRCARGVFDLHRPVFDSSRRVDHQHARDERFAPLHEAFAALRDARQVGMQICLQMGLQVGLQSDMDGRGEGACRTEARPTGAVGPGRMHQSGACCTAVGLFSAINPRFSAKNRLARCLLSGCCPLAVSSRAVLPPPTTAGPESVACIRTCNLVVPTRL